VEKLRFWAHCRHNARSAARHPVFEIFPSRRLATGRGGDFFDSGPALSPGLRCPRATAPGRADRRTPLCPVVDRRGPGDPGGGPCGRDRAGRPRASAAAAGDRPPDGPSGRAALCTTTTDRDRRPAVACSSACRSAALARRSGHGRSGACTAATRVCGHGRSPCPAGDCGRPERLDARPRRRRHSRNGRSRPRRHPQRALRRRSTAGCRSSGPAPSSRPPRRHGHAAPGRTFADARGEVIAWVGIVGV